MDKIKLAKELVRLSKELSSGNFFRLDADLASGFRYKHKNTLKDLLDPPAKDNDFDKKRMENFIEDLQKLVKKSTKNGD